MLLVITNGFEANFTVGFSRGLASQRIPLLVASCSDTHERLRALSIPSANIFGQRPKSANVLQKSWTLLAYHIRLLFLLLSNRGSTLHFIGVFRGYRAIMEGPFLAIASRLLCRRYYYTVHNVLPHGKDSSRFFFYLYRTLYLFPNRLFVHTAASRDQLIQRFKVPAEKIVITSIGLNEDIPETSLTVEEARKSFGFSPADRVLLFFGKVEPYKGLDTLLETFNALPDQNYRLLIAGDATNPAYRTKILALIDQNPRRSAIRLHMRHIPDEDVEQFFKSSDVLCLPYRNIYQSGLVFLAPRFGLPIICTDVGNLRSFVGDGGIGLVAASNDASGLANAIEEFFLQPDRFRRSNVRQKVLPYRWETICSHLVPYYLDRGTPGASA